MAASGGGAHASGPLEMNIGGFVVMATAIPFEPFHWSDRPTSKSNRCRRLTNGAALDSDVHWPRKHHVLVSSFAARRPPSPRLVNKASRRNTARSLLLPPPTSAPMRCQVAPLWRPSRLSARASLPTITHTHTHFKLEPQRQGGPPRLAPPQLHWHMAAARRTDARAPIVFGPFSVLKRKHTQVSTGCEGA